MNQRQVQLFRYIAAEYVKTAQPVGSDYLVDRYKLSISCATVRNECQVLEKEGYLSHPHTSAGRIPTEKGYRYLVNFDSSTRSPKEERESKALVLKDAKQLDKVYNKSSRLGLRDRIRNVAKFLAELAQAAVLVGFSRTDTFYTGLSCLFSQPEFEDRELVYNVSAVVDHFDEILADVYDSFSNEVTVKIGSENPFGADCSFIGARLGMAQGAGLFGLLGPMRMDYMENIQRVEHVKQLLAG